MYKHLLISLSKTNHLLIDVSDLHRIYEKDFWFKCSDKKFRSLRSSFYPFTSFFLNRGKKSSENIESK